MIPLKCRPPDIPQHLHYKVTRIILPVFLLDKPEFSSRKEIPRETQEELNPNPVLLERPGIRQDFPRMPPLSTEAQALPGRSPFAYGDADRMPGHPGFGGMLMDPLRSGGLGLRPPSYPPGVPRGSVPPGARFDPFGPQMEFDYSTGTTMPRGSFNPNPDHLRRPGFGDDSFM